MNDDEASQLFELGDLIHAVGRQIRLPEDLEPGPCSPVEIIVMRYIGENPGTSARAAAEAALLPSSNFSRVIRGLIAKGLVQRDADERDGRSVKLFPTEMARENTRRMRASWSKALDGILDDPKKIELINATLRKIERELIARRRESGERNA